MKTSAAETAWQPASAKAVEMLDECSGGDWDELASALESFAARCDATAEVLRIRKESSDFLTGLAELARTKTRECRKEAGDFQAWLLGKKKAEVRVTHSSDGSGGSGPKLEVA